MTHLTDSESNKKVTALIIMDGWGYREPADDNAIATARTPVSDHLWQTQPHTLIQASSHFVGLPDGQMGNSEVGHMSIGAGRVVFQNLVQINNAIESGEFNQNTVLCKTVDDVVNHDKSLHIMGLLSPGGVHSHERHITAMINMAVQQGAKKVYLHAFLDGRDTSPKSARASLQAVDQQLKSLNVGYIASLTGRYYAMDRDQRWDRVETAYNLITQGKGSFTSIDAISGLNEAYLRGESDEFVKATAVVPEGQSPVMINNGDAIVFMNFRADRARQLTCAFTDKNFNGFTRNILPKLSHFVTLTQYASDISAECAFPPVKLHNSLGEVLAKQGKNQLRLAETEKYAHVTFFFNGGKETPFDGEDRQLIPSPKVATYDLKPEMSAEEITDFFVKAIESGKYDFIVCNYANGDMVGHTGNFEATVKAIETVDTCVGRVVDALYKAGGQCLITADHGNSEQMTDQQTGQAHTAHTCEPVPLIYTGDKSFTFKSNGKLSDLAPTLLALMNIKQPVEMTGRCLVSKDNCK